MDVADGLVRGVVVEYPNGVRLRFASLTVETASRLLHELGQPAPKVAVPSVQDVAAYLQREATVRPLKTSTIQEALLGRRYVSRGADRATYNAFMHRLRRARAAINAGAEWECVTAPAADDSGEDTWFLAPRRPHG
jgi:hypothetical protein